MHGLPGSVPENPRSIVPGGDPEPRRDSHEEETLLAPARAGSSTDGEAATGVRPAPGVDSTVVGTPGLQPPLVPRRLGPFVLIEVLGRGRQAVVWKAVQFQPPRVVALKVFTTQWPLSDLSRVAQLRKEATESGRLADTAIMPIYEYGELEGHPYFAMPLVTGPCLADVVFQRRRDAVGIAAEGRHRLAGLPDRPYRRAVVRLLARVARGLGALHEAGAVHCDVKPANILLDGHVRAYLCDFGLARLRDDAPARPSGQATGTPIYMAREKLLDRPDVDEVLCDVYSMGVTLYEAVTLDRPFHIPAELPPEEWSKYLAGATPPPPRAARPDVPEDLEAIILKAMQRDPACRYPSATALAADLDGFLAAAARA